MMPYGIEIEHPLCSKIEHTLVEVHCKGGGGGGASGAVSYPGFMQDFLGDLLNADGVDAVLADHSMVDALNAAFGHSPYSSATAYAPTTPVSAILMAIGAYNTIVDTLNYKTDWEAMVDAAAAKVDATIVPAAYITAAVSAFGANLDDRVENEVLSRFESGMRDINAVMGSAFVIGRSYIEGMVDRDVAKFQADLKFGVDRERSQLISGGVGAMAGMLSGRVEGEYKVAHLTTEGNRLKIVAEKEQADEDLKIDVSHALWDLETFQYAANLLASIGGGTAIPTKMDDKGSKIGGALSGAAMGAMAGSVVPGGGNIVGAVIGGIGGYLSS